MTTPAFDKQAADNLRILSAAMVEQAKSGHPGGAMGGADFIHILYSEFLRYDPSDMSWPLRDRFFLDPGHMSPMLYGILHLMGHYSMDELRCFRQWGSPTPGHPEKEVARGVENTSGPLGQGHTMAIGAAIAERFLCARFGEGFAHKTYTYISDGGIQEEISQGAGRIAGHLGLHNLIMFFDSNDIQLSSTTSAVTSEDTARKYEAWGWRVMTIDGNDAAQIRGALAQAVQEKEKPFLIIGRTVMGKGALTAEGKSFERECETHGMPLSKSGASFEKTVLNLGGNPADPFTVFSPVATAYTAIRAQKIKEAAARKNKFADWEKRHPELAGKLKSFLSGELPDIDFAAIEQKKDIATRAAGKAVLSVFAKRVENMIVASADLSNSDNTDGFLKNSKAFTKGDFSGAFLQAGVCELTMASLMNGMALHGGVIPVCGTFFVFSDYMKPAVRLAALMELPVKYVWTHDAFRVGEDGPTHQPVEQEAQIRLMEQLKNHSGRKSMLVLRPADAAEATIAWKLALENNASPTALLLSRQTIQSLPANTGTTRYQEALQSAKGAYVVRDCEGAPDIILVANGSEVATLVAATEQLAKRTSAKIRIVSAISEGLFREQPLSYQEKVLPKGTPIFGLTAGLPVNLIGLAGACGKVVGLDHFGYSAPFQVLDEKFGFTPEKVAAEILHCLD